MRGLKRWGWRTCFCAATGLMVGCGSDNPPQDASLKVSMSSTVYPTLGYPMDSVVADTNTVLVSLSSVGGTAGSLASLPAAGVQVFQQTVGGLINPCATQAQHLFKMPDTSSITQVFGLKTYPAHPESIGFAVSESGVDFYTPKDFYSCALVETATNVQQPPRTARSPGTGDLAFTPDGKYAFVSNEYGKDTNYPAAVGTVGILKVVRSAEGDFTGTSLIASNHYIYIPGGNTMPGISLSHDGKRLYVSTEVAAPAEVPNAQDPTNSQNPILTGKRCYQTYDASLNPQPQWNGLLTVIDVEKAIAGLGQASIIQTIAAGCSPVRIVETSDGQRIWVSARGDNRVLAFDVAALLSSNPNKSLVGYANSGGSAPVGMTLFNRDQFLAVTNSNRFTPNNPPGDPNITNVAILDVRQPNQARVINALPSAGKGDFPRGVSVGPDGTTLYVTNYNVGTLQVIKTVTE